MTKRKSKVAILAILIFVLLCPLFFANTHIVNAVSVNAKGSILMDEATNEVLFENNAHAKLPMASTTKIMTALVAIEKLDLTQKIKVPAKAVGIEGSSIYLKKNEEIKIEDLLYGLMLQSGNDAAEALAIIVAGSKENFAKLMNEKALQIGANNTNFENPHGLDSANHYTTAYDLALITSTALKNEKFKTIVSTKNHKVEKTNLVQERFLFNKNKMLRNYEGAIGVKTGYTKKCGRCLVSAAERNGTTLICVVLNCPPMWEDSINLLNYGFNNYTYKTFISPYQNFDEIACEDSEQTTLKIYNDGGFNKLIKLSEEQEYTVTYDIPTSVKAPVKKEQKIGEICIYYKGEKIYTENVKATEEIVSNNTKNIIKEIIKEF